MDISIIGAGGGIGRQIAIGLVRGGLVPTTTRLQRVGHKGDLARQLLRMRHVNTVTMSDGR